jgi:hypothetical protein
VQIEDVARIGFAARRTAQQQRHLAIRDGLLRQVIIDDERVHAVVAEVLAHGAAGHRREILQRRGIRSGGRDDDRILRSAPLSSSVFTSLRDSRALLADDDVHAIELLALRRVPVVRFALIDHGVERDGGLAGLAVADDQLALAAADRDQRVDRLDARLHRLVHRLARNDARRLHVHGGALLGLDRALAVDRVAERVDHAAEQTLADRHVDDLAEALNSVAFFQAAVFAEDDDADVVAFEVEGHALHAARKLDHFTGLNVLEAIDAGDTVADRQGCGRSRRPSRQSRSP